jgi:citrate lyase subunit beta/citryl-CoA lyase
MSGVTAIQHAAGHPLAAIASLLFVPGNRPERFAKALGSGAGAVIVDWEDAVAPADKDLVRAHFVQAVKALPAADRTRLMVRINAPGTPWHDDDVAALPALVDLGLTSVVLPKAEDPADIARVARAMGPAGAVWPIVESAAGLDNVKAVAQAPQVLRLLFGDLDFQADLGLGCGPDGPELYAPRMAVVMASRLAGLPAPFDGVSPETKDMALVQSQAERALRGGFGGKLCIHPAQIAAVHAAFAPTPEKLAWAHEVLDGFAKHKGGVFNLNGKMVDAPVAKLAEQIVQRARGLGL